MKCLREKFKKNHVKPLYRKVNPRNVSVHRTYNLEGDDFTVRREISVVNGGINQHREKQDPILPGACERKYSKTVYNIRNNKLRRFKMVGSAGNSEPYDSNSKEKVDQLVQSDKFAINNVSNQVIISLELIDAGQCIIGHFPNVRDLRSKAFCCKAR